MSIPIDTLTEEELEALHIHGFRTALAQEPVVVKTLVLDLIDNLRATDPYIETIFTEGGCYQFHLWLKTQYPRAVALINPTEDHVITQIGGGFYDITGEVDSEGYRHTLDKQKSELESWSFAKNKLLSVGECEFCEEPILIRSGEGMDNIVATHTATSLLTVCLWWISAGILIYTGTRIFNSLGLVACGAWGLVLSVHYTVKFVKEKGGKK